MIRNARRAVTLASATLLSAALFGAMAGTAQSTELRISGAATVASGIIIPNQAAIEQETGLKLVMAVNGDGNGLKDLYAGRSEVAMVAAPIGLTEAAVNRANPGSLDVADFQLAPVGSAIIRFVVNPANPVRALSSAQLHDIFTGKLTSWKDVGGKDSPIVVVAETSGLGTRSNIVANFLGGVEITGTARIMQGLVQLTQVTAQLPDAISYGNNASINASVVTISGTEIKQELGLATKGKASPDVEKLIASVAKYGTAPK
jgi:phosphate transport system substrate-binding protein